MGTALLNNMTWEQLVDYYISKLGARSKRFREWFLSKKDTGGHFFDPPKQWLYLYNVHLKITKKDADHTELVVGKEGSGKSTFALQEACIVDPTFNRQRIFDNTLSLFRWLQRNRGNTKGKAILIDEGNLVLFNRETLKAANINIIKLFALMRQCNLYVIICVPSFKTIDSYIRDHRISALTRIRVPHKNYTHYNESGVKILAEWTKRGVPFHKVRVPEHMLYNGSWKKYLPTINDISRENYLAVKDKTWGDFLGATIDELTMHSEQERFCTIPQAQKIFPLDKKTYRKFVDNGTILGKKLARKYWIDRDALLELDTKGLKRQLNND